LEEEEMLDYSNYGGGKYVYLPTIKSEETLEIHIKEIREVRTGLPKFHFTKMEVVKGADGNPVMVAGVPLKAPVNMEFHIEAELMDGRVLSVTSFPAFIEVFIKNKLQDGDKVSIQHKDKGIWIVEKL
jgi:hypothetical protein